jgi:hypothetical protein
MQIAKSVFLPISVGLIVAQLIATGFVFLSNLEVHELVLAAEKNDFFAIPHGKAFTALTTWSAAFWGGLFYTLSIGIGLTLLTWTAWHVWTIFFHKNRYMIILFFLLWIALLIAVNLQGPVLFPTLFCLFVPLGTAGIMYKIGQISSGTGRCMVIIPVTTLGLLTALWASQLNQNLFIGIRDHLLLSNTVGRTVNDFYYRYTLYAAQSFKAVYQKTLRTYHLSGEIDKDLAGRVKARLSRFDVLHVPQLRKPDITIAITKNRILLASKRGDLTEGDLAAFLKNPSNLLKSFSLASDRYKPLRRMTLYGLLLGFPILLFIMVYNVLRIGMDMVLCRRFKMTQRSATIATAMLCLVIGIGLYWPMRASTPDPISDDRLPDALTANSWPERVAALRHVEMQRIELANYPQYRRLLRSALPVERYWLARALAASRSPSTYADLLSLVDDTHPNVRCQVYYALGNRGNRTAVKLIKAQITASDHWYTQWYGYRALRRLGWHQGLSNS